MSAFLRAALRRLPWRAEHAAACLTLLLGAAPAAAQDAFVDTSIRGSLWSEGDPAKPSESIGHVDAWVRGEAAVSESVTISGEAWASASSPASSAIHGDVREAWLRWRGEMAEVRIGRQVLAWGKGDRINPTDMLAARDWRRLVVEDDDNRLGQFVTSVAFDAGGGKITALWLPEFRASAPPVATPGLIDRAPDNAVAQGAIRLDVFTAGVDWSTSLSSVYDRMPTVAADATVSGPLVLGEHPRRVTLGADAAFAIGALNVRVEGAAYLTSDGLRPGGLHTPRAFLTLGADHTFDEGWNINGQIIFKLNSRRTEDPTAPLAAALATTNDLLQGSWSETITGVAVRLQRTFFNDQASAEITATALQRGGQSVEAKLNWSPADAWRLTAGGRYYIGNDETFFGAQRDRGGAFVEVRHGF